MTQSGQGEEPSARPAREGIVLPSDGGEPLLPGMTGGPGDAPGRRPAPPTTGGPQSSAPAEGQTWGGPWGPGRQQTPPPPPGQTWQSEPQQWSAPEPPAWDAHAPGALPPEGTQPPSPYAGTPANPGPYGTAQPPAGHEGYDPYGAQGGGAPLPPEGSGTHGAGQAGPPQQSAAGYGPPAGGGLPQTTSGYGYPHGAGLPQGTDAYGAPAGGGAQPQPGSGAHAAGSGDWQVPQQGSGYGYPHGAGLPPAAGAYGPVGTGAPLPSPADEGATQYIPPVAGDAAAAATQYLPPVAPAADEGATQYIPPVGPGALPPEMSSGEDPEATRFLGTGPRAGAGAGPLPAASHPTASHPDAEATQYIPPVPGADKQPPAEFDNLFRSEGGAESPAGATQQMPRIEQPRPQSQPSYGAPQPSHAPPAGGRSRGGRSGSRVPVIAAVGIGIAVLGVGAGALLAAGGGGDDDGGDKKTVAASAPATDGSASPSADPARAQAVELDKLLADSGNSRSTVINAVADVKGCDNLPKAAKDLRDAAKQRSGLVTRLSGIEVDELPGHAALTTALTKAWQASASADNHYAAWADQTAGKKGCKKGQARVTGQTQAGNRASGVASAEKAKAAGVWNGIAKKYGLTERQPTQL
ncbi:hypothetical protein [Streptomyces hawaiiensis]|uniref:Uncharacterized protein n=1 Tax=Streptomyces hawaiiensis TaxID=67305 RepID=A0A6G5RFG4_9ACTN|nr:hypothetical protein [Streptomyces hawaiiensis]QCD56551.1 hypothetical protein CEB94_18055 [Streptomyces hawaiiensis]